MPVSVAGVELSTGAEESAVTDESVVTAPSTEEPVSVCASAAPSLLGDEASKAASNTLSDVPSNDASGSPRGVLAPQPATSPAVRAQRAARHATRGAM